MVGIVKSRACHSCRKRRVACGYERPSCLRCEKAGVQCPGYQRQATFVNRTLANPSTTAQDAISTFAGCNNQAAQEDIVQDYLTVSRAFMSSSYATHDFRATVYRILRRLYLPREGVRDASLAVGTYLWVESVCNCTQESSTLDHALLALCAAQLYITNHGDITLDQALDIYSGGLARLAAGLEHVDYSTLACLLGSIVTLSTCELFICPLTSGWRAHSQGMAQLLRYRIDIDLYYRGGVAQQAWTNLCARVRIVSVLTALMSQSHVSVTSTQWRAIMPDRIVPDDPLDELLEIMSELPALFAEPETFDAPVASILRVLDHAYDWERRFRKRTGTASYSFVPSRLDNPADVGFDEKLYPLVLEFPSLQIASCLIVFWGAMLQTLTMVMRLYNEAGSDAAQSLLDLVWRFLDSKKFRHTRPETAITVEARRVAGLLCQSVEYTHRPEMGSTGPQSMTYARSLLLRYFSEQRITRELSWCQNIRHMTDARGERFAVQMLDVRV